MSYETIAKKTATLTLTEQLDLLSYLANLIKEKEQKTLSKSKNDFSDTYPEGYFDLFGSDPTYPEEPKELSWQL